MNRSTVISMVQDLTEHKADQRLDFNNLFNLRLVKFIQEKPFWWRKKIFSFTTQPGVPTYDLAALATPGELLAIDFAQFTPGVNTVQLSFFAAIPSWMVVGAQISGIDISDSAFNGGPWTVTTVFAGSPNWIGLTANLGPDPIPLVGNETVTGNIQHNPTPLVIASDVESFIKAELWLGSQKITEMEPNFDIEDISDAQEDTTQGPPSTYCIEPGTLTTLRLMMIPDHAYKFKAAYWACPQPGDDYSDDAIPLIPPMYHHGLVSGLKMDVAGFLYGEKSNIYNVAVSEYQESVAKACARQDISAEKNLQFIVREDSVRSVTGSQH